MKLSIRSRAQEFLRLHEQEKKAEVVLNRIQEELDVLYLEPFKTLGIHCNASYILSGLLKEPDSIFLSSTGLLRVKGTGMYFSNDTMANHIGRIFKHFKETGLLVKAKKGFKLNPALKGLVKEIA